MDQALVVGILFAAVAALYASVGHAGTSGYLAVMAIVGVEPSLMRPTALILNILVAAIVVVRFARAGRIDWPALLTEAEAMSDGQRLLVHVAHDLWRAEGEVGIRDLARGLDPTSFERVVNALRLYRGFPSIEDAA